MKTANLHPKAANLDRLAESELLDIAALKAITGKSRATIYRWIEKGALPSPRKIGNSHNLWSVGEVRRALKG